MGVATLLLQRIPPKSVHCDCELLEDLNVKLKLVQVEVEAELLPCEGFGGLLE